MLFSRLGLLRSALFLFCLEFYKTLHCAADSLYLPKTSISSLALSVSSEEMKREEIAIALLEELHPMLTTQDSAKRPLLL
jgi:hypothetical protein